MDTNYISLRSSNNTSLAPYIYPQALAKQLKLNKQPKYMENDFTLLVNNCESLPQYKNNEIRSIMTHEIFHGLGFASIAQLSKLTDKTTVDLNEENQEIVYNKDDKYTI